jgi:hypothetical protein
MALLTTQVPTPTAGLVPSYGAANASDTFVPDDRTFIYVKNTNASTRTITITTPATVRGLAVQDPGPTISATTGELVLGPFPADTYADPTNSGLCTITPSATAGVTYAVVRLTVT